MSEQEVYFESDLNLARFLTAASFSGRVRALRVPKDEVSRRTYDDETLRLVRFLHGQEAASRVQLIWGGAR